MTATTSTPTPDPPTPTRAPLRRRLTGLNGSRLFVTLLAMWIILVSFGAQLTAWVQAGLTTLPGDPRPWWMASLIQAALIGLPVLGFALRWRVMRYRAIFRTWAWATGYLLLLTPTRLLPPIESQNVVLLQTILTFGYWLVVRRRQRETSPVPQSGIALALLVAGVLSLPWLRWGALGSPLDLLLNSALSLAFGLLLWTIMHVAWIPAQRRDPRHPRRDRMTGGLVMGVALVIMASALSFNGVQLPLMLMLPSLGWALVATGAFTVATALALAAPLLFIDSDALVIVATDWLLAYYFIAALISMTTGWILALVAMLFQPDPAKFVPRPLAWTAGVASIALAIVVYATSGQVGFHGDRLFVVLRDQADLSEVVALPDLTERRSAVYHRLVEHADATQADLRAALDRFGISYQPYYLTNALEVDGGLLVRWWLDTRDDVAEIMASPRMRPVEPLQLPGEELLSAPEKAQWNLTTIGADRVWNELGVRGEGIVIGQSDSGVQGDHPEFAARYRGVESGHDYNWYDPWQHAREPYDLSGHGTHTLGSVLGESVGVAPGAVWFGCANLIRNLGNPALYLDCMQFMLAPFPLDGDPLRDGDPRMAADVLNNSWGCPGDVEGCAPSVFAPAVDALTKAGIFVVVSAGNDGPLCSSITAPPSIYEQVLTVGAINETGDLAGFSSVGPVTIDGSGRTKPDVLAPGVDVLSAWPGGGYQRLSGTSMAGPHVAGAVALMWSANPALRGDIERTRAILQDTARPFAGGLESELSAANPEVIETGGPLAEMIAAEYERSCLAQTDLSVVPNNVAGYGVIDIYAAVQAAIAQE